MKLSVIIPLLNEEDNIVPLYQRLKKTLDSLQCEYEIIFVNDGSSDTTEAKILALREQDARLKLLTFSRNFGHQIALTAGLDYASGDAVITMDADLQHPPEVIPDMVARWKEGYPLVYSVRRSTDSGLLKRLMSSIFYRCFRLFSGITLPFYAADFRLMERRVVNAIRSLREHTRFLRGLTYWTGYRSTAVSYDAPARNAGHTKYTPLRMMRLAIDAITSFSVAPLYLAIVAGIMCMTLGLFYFLFVFYAWYVTGHVLPGWTSLVVVILVIGGIQLLLMGVMGLYIATIYQEVKARPLYIVDHAIGIDPASNR